MDNRQSEKLDRFNKLTRLRSLRKEPQPQFFIRIVATTSGKEGSGDGELE